ncbi:MAG: SDR family NAD(P)-dependent oxidoreductase, partial [Pseudanabaena sp.]
MNVRGKTALITGASRGIGRAIALELAQQGAKCLILVARDRDRLNLVASEVEALGIRAVILPLDLSQTIEVNIAIAQVWRDLGPIDILINCAGVAHQSSFLHSRFQDVQSEIEVNLLGMYAITRMVARRMAVQRNGRIVNVSSLMGKVAAPTMATYSATKFAIVGFTQALRGELAAYNIKVSALLPSLTDTDMAHDLQWFLLVSLMTPKQVARALITGLDREAPECRVGWPSQLAGWW